MGFVGTTFSSFAVSRFAGTREFSRDSRSSLR